ncbi:MAG: FtsX-like permease family protein [Acidobacteriota bacterium]
MRAIHRKLLRDLWQIKGQALAIALVIGAGVAMFVMYFSTFDSLRLTRDNYYAEQRFGDVFAALKRAPNRLERHAEMIPGVAAADTRVVAQVNLDVPDEVDPVSARLVSIPETDTATLNDLFLRRGRYLDPARADEVIASEAFALERGLEPGDEITAIINGRRRDLEIVGIGLSPEFVFTIRPGELMPDNSRFGILWMGREALAAAYDMEGGFNDLSLRLAEGASEADVIDRVDELLEPYGGLGAVPRRLQISNWYLDAELAQLRGFGSIVPMIFLGVAAFLLNVVLTRIVAVQREQIAALKALGYDNREIGLHYTLWSLAIASAGGFLGLGLGRWMGQGMIGLYNEYYKFPVLSFQIPDHVLAAAGSIALVAAVAGAGSAVRRAVSLPPAEAMRPEAPAVFRRTLVERLGLARFLDQPSRIVLRNLERRPFRTLASVIGVAFSGGLLIIGLFFQDAIDAILEVQFDLAQRQDVIVSFVEPRGSAAVYELQRLPGVELVEPARDVAVRLRAGHRSRQTSISGLAGEARLKRVVDTAERVRRLPPEGLVLSATLAEILEVGVGDEVTVEVLEGRRPTRRLAVAELIDEYMGTSAYMEVEALRDLMREGGVVSGAYLSVDSKVAERLYHRLREIPAVVGVSLKQAAIDAFNRQMDETMGIMIFFNILFASVITIGVVYNAARIALSERSRELASLRVIGFTRGEISYILLGELAVIIACAIPLGLLLGYGFAGFIVNAFETELYRFPLVVSRRTYAVSALVVTGAAIVSGLLVRRRLDHLDLVEVLKTRE